MRVSFLVLAAALAATSTAKATVDTQALLNENNRLLEVNRQYQVSLTQAQSTSNLSDPSSLRQMMCYLSQSNAIAQLVGVVSNATGLNLAASMVSNPQEKAKIVQMAQSVMKAAKGYTNTALPFFRDQASAPACQAGNLPQLNQAATQIITDMRGSLDQVPE